MHAARARHSCPHTLTSITARQSEQRAIKPHELAMNRRRDCFAGKPAAVHSFKAPTTKKRPYPLAYIFTVIWSYASRSRYVGVLVAKYEEEPSMGLGGALRNN